MATDSINTEMLILARESRGWSQRDLAAETGISQANISKYENGMLQVAPEHLARMADALDFTVEFFSASGRRMGFGSSCTYHRKRATMPVKELQRLLAFVNVTRIRLERLLNNVEIDAVNEFPRYDVAEYGDDPAYIAQLVRRLWKMPPGPVKNMVASIESAGGIVMRVSFGTPKLDAISQVVPSMPPIFVLNADMPEDRLRHTTAHELGHIVMHQAADVPDSDLEGQADKFAAEFLMPAADIRHDLRGLTWPRLAQLKAYWKVSMASLIYRARELGAIDAGMAERFWVERSKLGYTRVEPVELPTERPALVCELMEAHHEDMQYSDTDLRKLLFTKRRDVVSQFSSGMSGLQLIS